MQEVKDPVKQAQLVEVSHWLRMMGRLQDPVVARLVLAFLEQNARLRDQHPGAYLLASETVKRDQIRYAKAYALGKLAVSVSRATARGTAAAFKCLGMLGSISLSGASKLIDGLNWPAPREVQCKAPAWRRCVVRRQRGELHAQRGVTRTRG